MSQKKIARPRRTAVGPTPFEMARDELFQHVIRCEVVGSHPDHQREWFDQTMGYMQERYHELTGAELGELRTLGERFAQPAKAAQAISA